MLRDTKGYKMRTKCKIQKPAKSQNYCELVT